MSTEKERYIESIQVRYSDGVSEHVSVPHKCKLVKIVFETYFKSD